MNLSEDAASMHAERIFSSAPLVAELLLTPTRTSRQFHQALHALLVPLAEAFGHQQRARRAARGLWPDVETGLRDAPLQARVTFNDGRLRVAYVTSVVGCAWLAVAILLDDSHGLAGRLGRCGACGRFNVAFSGKPRRHCNDEHLDQYRAMTTTERVARWRERQRERPTAGAGARRTPLVPDIRRRRIKLD